MKQKISSFFKLGLKPKNIGGYIILGLIWAFILAVVASTLYLCTLVWENSHWSVGVMITLLLGLYVGIDRKLTEVHKAQQVNFVLTKAVLDFVTSADEEEEDSK